MKSYAMPVMQTIQALGIIFIAWVHRPDLRRWQVSAFATVVMVGLIWEIWNFALKG